MDRRSLFAVAVAGLLAVAVLVAWLATPRSAPTEASVAASARPEAPPEPRREVRLRRPAEAPASPAAEAADAEAAEAPAVVWPDLPEPWREYAASVTNVSLGQSGSACIQAWMAANGVEERVELVLETVTDAEGLVDVRVTYGDEVDPSVDACLQEMLWDVPWPTLPVDGELVTEASFFVDPPTPANAADPAAARERALQTARINGEAMRQVHGIGGP